MHGIEIGEVIDILLTVVIFLGGCAIGVIYGLEGWRGSTKGISLKDSPRIKNLIWVLGAGAAAFIADFKAVDPKANRGELLLIYAIGFFLGGAITVLVSAAAIGLKFFRLKHSNPQNVPPEPFSPVFDYLRYGFEYYQSQYEAALAGQREANRRDLVAKFTRYRNYIRTYSDQLSRSIAATESVGGSNARVAMVPNILRSIRAVVIAYHTKESAPEINANFMEAIPAAQLNESQWEKVRFYEKKEKAGNNRYEYFLALSEYAVDQGKEDFIIPVEKRNDPKYSQQVLPGAPEAFMKLYPVAIADTSKIEYSDHLPDAVKKEMKDYFKSKQFKSFGSVPVVGKQPLGVVNVDSNDVNVFGSSEQENKEIASLLSPFCVLLGQIVEQ